MDYYISMIAAYGFNWAMHNWAMCNGQIMSIAQNQALFSLVGTTYGGDGRTTLGLPNLQGRAPIHYGTGTGLNTVPIGASGGAEAVTLTQANMPVHTHGVNLSAAVPASQAFLPVSSNPAGLGDPNGNYLGTQRGGATYADTLSDPAGQMGPITIPASQIQINGQTGAAGGSMPFGTRSPYQAVNYQICLFGLYPSRQ